MPLITELHDLSVAADVTDDELCLVGGGIVVVTGKAMAAWCAVNGIFAGEGLLALQFVVVEVVEGGAEVEGVAESCFPHPGPPEGTKDTAASVPLCSDFIEGRLAGGRLALGTLPRLCMPYLKAGVLFCCCFSDDSPRLAR